MLRRPILEYLDSYFSFAFLNRSVGNFPSVFTPTTKPGGGLGIRLRAIHAPFVCISSRTVGLTHWPLPMDSVFGRAGQLTQLVFSLTALIIIRVPPRDFRPLYDFIGYLWLSGEYGW